MKTSLPALALTAGLLALSLVGCRSAYYSTLERFGVHKREILVDRVEEGRAEQEEAQEQFVDTYELFKSLTGVEGGALEEAYEDLSDELEDCEDRAAAVRDRIASIDTVAGDLFEEWEEEIETIQSADLRGKSRASLGQTRERYAQLIGAMRQAEGRMDPVLVALRDNVLFLKHNLNARAIGSLRGTVAEIEADVDALIADMQRSIREADAFISSIEG